MRAVSYRLFVRGAIPNMGTGSTKRVSEALKWVREQGIVPWAWIVDEGRERETFTSWTGLADYADTFAYFLEAKYKFMPQLFGALRWNGFT